LHDFVTIDGQDGQIFPEKCCLIELPKSEGLSAARNIENCSAIGGPVGRFRIADGKIWLVGLFRCAGDIPLEDIYPEMENPAHATWLSGVFYAAINFMCRKPNSFGSLYRTTFRLEIEKGVISNMQRKENDEAACQTGYEPDRKPMP